MDLPKEASHKGRILKALSQVPIARIDQIAKLFSNGSPAKRASEQLNKLEEEKMVEFTWHNRTKVWKVTNKYLKMTNGSRQKCEHIDHALAVADIYFHLKPFQWLYEPTQRFTHNSLPYVWNPDCVLGRITKEGKKTLEVYELQRTPLSEKQWKAKFSIYNMYFQEAYKTAEFQQWHSKSEPIIPHVIVISNQGNVTGLEKGCKVITDISQLG